MKAIVDLVKERGRKAKYCISTNGISLSGLEWMVSEGNFSFNLSCDGHPEIQDFQRPLKNGKSSSKTLWYFCTQTFATNFVYEYISKTMARCKTDSLISNRYST